VTLQTIDPSARILQGGDEFRVAPIGSLQSFPQGRQALDAVLHGRPLARRCVEHAILWFFHPQVVGNREDSGDAIGANTRNVLVSFVVNDPLQSCPSHVHDNSDRFLHAQSILFQRR